MTLFKLLSEISQNQLLDCFNIAFSDYIIPMHLNKEQLLAKFITENIDLNLSVGAFKGKQLVGFILHGFNKDTLSLYNAATGIIPSERGFGLTKKMYDYITPVLRQNQFKKVQLEVIFNNLSAIKAYEKIGFIKSRELLCYKGDFNHYMTSNDLEIRLMNVLDWNTISSFWDVQPSWQNDIQAINLFKESLVPIGIYREDRLLGYAIYNSKTTKIAQISIAKNERKNKLGCLLISYLSKHFGRSFIVTNVDAESKDLNSFYTQIGLRLFITQHEMELQIK